MFVSSQFTHTPVNLSCTIPRYKVKLEGLLLHRLQRDEFSNTFHEMNQDQQTPRDHGLVCAPPSLSRSISHTLTHTRTHSLSLCSLFRSLSTLAFSLSRARSLSLSISLSYLLHPPCADVAAVLICFCASRVSTKEEERGQTRAQSNLRRFPQHPNSKPKPETRNPKPETLNLTPDPTP